MTIYSEMITVSVNKALKKKLRKEARGAANNEAANLFSNAVFTKKRRHAEDVMLARELGVNIEDLL
tara:strand:+ start:830 stop:1027 length:198 start_codon:yes stop_codon:yes gene_type:complete